jgi:hypothetical protein
MIELQWFVVRILLLLSLSEIELDFEQVNRFYCKHVCAIGFHYKQVSRFV